MRTALLLCGLAVALACLLTGCGGGSDGAALTDVTVYPAQLDARVGDVVAMAATAHYADGSQKLATRQATWTSSAPTVGAVSAAGVFTAKQAGQAGVTARIGQLSSAATQVAVSAVPALPTAQWFPLGLQHEWKYTGTEVQSTKVGTRAVPVTLTITISQQVARNGQVWYQLVVKGSDATDAPGEMLLRHDPDGLVRYDAGGTVPVRILDGSLAADATWQDPEDPRRTFKIESTSEQVVVPAGTYNDCIKVVETDTYYTPPNVITAWYQAGVGLVKQEQHSGADLVAEQRLLSVRLGLP